MKTIRKYAAALLAGAALALWLPAFAGGAAVCAEAANGGKAAEDTPEPPELYAQSAVLMDMDTGRILYEKEGETGRPMASTTKIMTCILALEQGNPEDWVSVSARAASMPDVQLNIREGERYRLGDLLYSLMLESHNDSAVAVAEHIGGSVEGFAAMMNQKARELGCQNTNFVTPNGLDGVGEDGRAHATTAADLARIMRYCVSQSPKREEFLNITRTASRTITDEEKKRSFYLANHNALLTMLPEALSGKTGFTSGAGYCYVAALEADGKRFSVALLGCGWPPHKTYKWDDMRRLSRYAFDSYEKYDIFDRGRELPRIPVTDGVKDSTALTLDLEAGEEELTILMRAGERPDIRYEYPGSLPAPVEKGAAVGSVTYAVGGETIAVYPLYAAESVKPIDYRWCLGRCLAAFGV